MKVALPFTPRPWQRPLLNLHAPRAVIVVHRRAGKTTMLMWRALRKAATSARAHLPAAVRNLDGAPPRVIHVLPERVQWSRTGLWGQVERAAAAIPGAEAVKSELMVKLPGGRTFQAGGMDNPESWRGGYADEIIEDEADDVTAGGLDMVVEPMLSDYQGTRIHAGTPKGAGRLAGLWDRAGAEGWPRVRLAWQDTGVVGAIDRALAPDMHEQAIARLRSQLTPEEFAQEMEVSFEAPNSGSYYGRLLDQAERDGRIARVPYDPRLPVETWWDLGMDDATALWFVQLLPGSGEVRVIDYAEASGEALGFYAALLAGRGYHYAAHRLPHDVQVRELGTGRSRKETLESLGVRPIRVGRALPVTDGINAAKMLLPRCWFDAEKTAAGRRWLRLYRREWIEERGVWSAKPLHDGSSHAADAFREGAVNFREVADPSAPPLRAQAEGSGFDPLGRG